MRTIAKMIAFSQALLFLPAPAWPFDQDSGSATAQGAAPMSPQGEPEAVPPAGSQPAQPPPLPPADVPAPQAQGQPSQSAAQGQWVYTQQYGWVWMPYGAGYTYAPPDGYGQPYMYVYYPAYGWTWLVAPWVWGWGPWPYFGFHGPWRFAWYGYGWWRYPWRWHFAPAPFAGFRHYGPRPGPYWGAFPHGGFARGGVPFRHGGGVPFGHGGGVPFGHGGMAGGHFRGGHHR